MSYSNEAALKIHTAQFNPLKFRKDWRILIEEQDEKSSALPSINFGEASFLSCLREREPSISGEEKLIRLKSKDIIRYGVTAFAGLWEDFQMKTERSALESLRQIRNITYMDFFGDVLVTPGGFRYILFLSYDRNNRDEIFRWRRGYTTLDSSFDAETVSAVCQINP